MRTKLRGSRDGGWHRTGAVLGSEEAQGPSGGRKGSLCTPEDRDSRVWPQAGRERLRDSFGQEPGQGSCPKEVLPGSQESRTGGRPGEKC